MQILEKRTADARLFSIDCSLLLDPAETITSVTSITSDQGGLTFGTVAINSAVLNYPNGRQAQVGKVMQFTISGGTIPAGQISLMCIVRALMQTSINPAIEATAILKLTNTPKI